MKWLVFSLVLLSGCERDGLYSSGDDGCEYVVVVSKHHTDTKIPCVICRAMQGGLAVSCDWSRVSE